VSFSDTAWRRLSGGEILQGAPENLWQVRMDSCQERRRLGWVSDFDIKQWHELNGSGGQRRCLGTGASQPRPLHARQFRRYVLCCRKPRAAMPTVALLGNQVGTDRFRQDTLHRTGRIRHPCQCDPARRRRGPRIQRLLEGRAKLSGKSVEEEKKSARSIQSLQRFVVRPTPHAVSHCYFQQSVS
jgi:hypothetical protein